jgi:hypothetical protein
MVACLVSTPERRKNRYNVTFLTEDQMEATSTNTKSQDFTCSISASVTPAEALEKIARVSEWWAKNTEGPSNQLNDIFTIRWAGPYVTFKITEAITNERVVWHVTDCHLPWLKDQNEWTGTDVIFDLTQDANQTRIDFMHRGLVPEMECYDSCVKGWTQYVPGSLLNFLNEGQGQPG